jgi:hypothetical protein
VPTRVIKPFRLSDRCEDTTRVDPCSVGASRDDTSSSPALRSFRLSCSAARSHSSSLAYTYCYLLCAQESSVNTNDLRSSSANCPAGMDGQAAVAIVKVVRSGTTSSRIMIRMSSDDVFDSTCPHLDLGQEIYKARAFGAIPIVAHACGSELARLGNEAPKACYWHEKRRIEIFGRTKCSVSICNILYVSSTTD